MAALAGKWKIVEKSNNDKLMEQMGCPPEVIQAVANVESHLITENIWNSSTKTLSVTRTDKPGRMDEVKVGAEIEFGRHAPGWKSAIYEIGNDVIKAKIKNPQGQEVGHRETRVEGNKFQMVTTVNGVTGKVVLQKVE